MLTRRQSELLTFIDGYSRENAIAPTFDEMANHLGVVSKSGVHRLLCALAERGFIRRIPSRARAIEVVKMPASGTSELDLLKSDNAKLREDVRVFALSGDIPVRACADCAAPLFPWDDCVKGGAPRCRWVTGMPDRPCYGYRIHSKATEGALVRTAPGVLTTPSGVVVEPWDRSSEDAEARFARRGGTRIIEQ